MILTAIEIEALFPASDAARIYANGDVRLSMSDLEKIMQEVERRTAEETRDKICNKLDDWIHGMCYEY